MSGGPQEFRDRLRRLRRDSETRADPVSSPQNQPAARTDNLAHREALPVWMAAKLRARDRRAAAKAMERNGAEEVHANLQPASSEPLRQLETRTNHHGAFRERVTRYPLAYVHGAMRLDAIEESDSRAFEFFTEDPNLAELELRRAVFLDTETTGLSGGAGTYVFQVGLGRFTNEGGDAHFELWQGFMHGPEDEAALLHETALRIADSTGVVSFFGKSFDRHRLEDKMRLHGIDPPFTDRAHLDLYHPLRRIFRGRFDDGKLRTMEQRLCGLERPDDLPGAFAPAAWFDYIAGRPHRLEGVFQHNADDVLSLVTLAAWMGTALKGKDPSPPALPLARARGWATRKDWRSSAQEAELALQIATDDSDRLAAERLLARSHARQGEWQTALDLWQGAARRDEGSLLDGVEAAKCAEKLRRYDLALQCCAAARKKSGTAPALRDLEIRAVRLERRISEKK